MNSFHKIKNRKWSLKKLGFLLILAAFTATLFQEKGQAWAHQKSKNLLLVTVIRVEDGRSLPVRIKDNFAYYEENADTFQTRRDYIQTFEQLKDSIVKNEGFQVIEKQNSKYGFAYFESFTPNAEITFALPKWQETVVTFFSGEACGLFQIQVEESTLYNTPFLIYNPESTSERPGETRLYPFEHNSFIENYCWYIVFYGVLTAAFFTLYTLIYFLISISNKKNKFLFGYRRWALFGAIFGLQMLSQSLMYSLPQTNFRVSGMADAYYYANPQVFDTNGIFSFTAWVENSWTHRGFNSQIFSLIRNTIAKRIGIDPQYLFFIEMSLLIAFVFSIVLPRFYHLLTGRQPYHLQSLICWILFNVYYWYYLFYTLCDIQAAFFALSGLCWFLSGVQKNRLRDLFIAGLLLSTATNYRATHKTLIWITLALVIIFPLCKKFYRKAKKDQVENKCGKAFIFYKKIIYSLVAIVIGVLVAALPQYVITYLGSGTGHFFPYSTASSQDYINNHPREQIAGNIYGSMSTYYFLHPVYKDRQMGNFSQTVYTEKVYTMKDIINCCMNRPLDFFSIYLKKIFYAFSPEVYDPYKDVEVNIIAPSWVIPLSRLLIFWMQGSLLYSLFKRESRKKLYSKTTLGMSLLILITSGAIGALLNLEWRYLLLSHILIFFLTAFYILDGYLVGTKYYREKLFGTSYMVFLLLYCWGAMTVEMTIITNFL